jgi:tRNA(fMet)-specific endonuclease VapC
VSYLFDTDILSNLLKKTPSAELLRRLAATPREEQFTSSITLGELVYGAHRSDRATDLLRRIDHDLPPVVDVVSFDEDAARVYGDIRAQLERLGTPLAEPDLRIAAIALSRQLTLVTGNVRHFARVPGLVVENWLDPPPTRP